MGPLSGNFVMEAVCLEPFFRMTVPDFTKDRIMTEPMKGCLLITSTEKGLIKWR